jgi:hypothetical protein
MSEFSDELKQELAVQRKRAEAYQMLIDNPAPSQSNQKRMDFIRLEYCWNRISEIERELSAIDAMTTAPTPPATVTAGG